MRGKIIDTYRYCSKKDGAKKDYYINHAFTSEEKDKTEKLINKVSDFFKKVYNNDNITEFEKYFNGGIYYHDGIGYISLVNDDRDIIDVYYYGKTLEEAFKNAIVDYEFYVNLHIEFINREVFKKDYSKRFLNNDYQGQLFFAELAMNDFSKFYQDNLPKEIVDYYEKYLKSIYEEDFKYDYESKKFIKKYL